MNEPEVQISRPELIEEDYSRQYEEAAKQVGLRPELVTEKKQKINIIKQNGYIVIECNPPMERLVITKKDARELARRISKEALG